MTPMTAAKSVVHHGLAAGPCRALHGLLHRGQRIRAKRPANAPHALWVRAGTADIFTHETVIRQREYDLPLRAGTPRVILDLGANIGLTAVWYANRYPSARIVCVECEPANYDLLVANTRGYERIETIHAAVWSQSGSITVTDPGEGEWAYRVEEGARGAEVEALTVDGLMDRFGLERVDLLKVDVEGAESQIFADPSAWIRHVQAIVAELHESIAPGCTAIFDRATVDFPVRAVRGLNIQVER